MRAFPMINNLILAALILGVGAMWGYGAYYGPPQPELDEQEIAQEMGEMVTDNSETIARESYQLTRDVVPPLANAMQKQLEEDYPKYVKVLDRESETYVEDLEQTLMDETKQQMDEFWKAQRKALAAEFPEYADGEQIDQLINEFRQVGDRLMSRYSLEEMKNQSERTMDLWEKVEPVSQSSQDSAEIREQLLEYLSDWLVLKLSDKAEGELSAVVN